MTKPLDTKPLSDYAKLHKRVQKYITVADKGMEEIDDLYILLYTSAKSPKLTALLKSLGAVISISKLYSDYVYAHEIKNLAYDTSVGFPLFLSGIDINE